MGFEDILRHYYTDVELVTLTNYFEMAEAQLAWEKKGFVSTWAAVLGPEQGIGGKSQTSWNSLLTASPSPSSLGADGGLWLFDLYTGSLNKLLAEPVVEIAWKGDGSAVAAVSNADKTGLMRLSSIQVPRDAAGK